MGPPGSIWGLTLKKFFYSFTEKIVNKQQIIAGAYTVFWLLVVKKYAKLKISAKAIYLSIVGAILKWLQEDAIVVS